MKTTIEIEVHGSEARIINAEVRSDGTCKLTVDVALPGRKAEATVEATKKGVNAEYDMLELIEASKLSLEDEFMQYEPKEGTNEARFKESLTKIIQSGTLSDFWRPKMDPSFTEDEKSICYMAGKKPAVGKSFNWWKNTAKKIGFQVGTRKQYVSFMGCLIKKLVEKGWDMKEAWYAVCTDSKSLGNYLNSEGTKNEFEMTGRREVCKFYDLGNTFKLLAEDEERDGGYWIAGGNCSNTGITYPLASLGHYYQTDYLNIGGVGWLVRNCD